MERKRIIEPDLCGLVRFILKHSEFTYLLELWSGTPHTSLECDSRVERVLIEELNWAISLTPRITCLTSPYLYVREYKKWLAKES